MSNKKRTETLNKIKISARYSWRLLLWNCNTITSFNIHGWIIRVSRRNNIGNAKRDGAGFGGLGRGECDLAIGAGGAAGGS